MKIKILSLPELSLKLKISKYNTRKQLKGKSQHRVVIIVTDITLIVIHMTIILTDIAIILTDIVIIVTDIAIIVTDIATMVIGMILK